VARAAKFPIAYSEDSPKSSGEAIAEFAEQAKKKQEKRTVISINVKNESLSAFLGLTGLFSICANRHCTTAHIIYGKVCHVAFGIFYIFHKVRIFYGLCSNCTYRISGG
jgi:hypothetical protein